MVWFRPSCTTLCLLGMDGSGKTTIATRLVKALSLTGVESRYFPSRHGLIACLPHRLRERPGNVLLATAQACNGTVSTRGIRLLYLRALLLVMCVDGFVGYWLFVWPQLRRGVMVFDRYFYDHVIPQLELAPHWLRWCYLHLIPRPDLVVLLDLTPEEAYERKPEFPFDFFRNMRPRFLQFAELLGDRAIVVNSASQPPEEIVRFLHGRVQSLRQCRGQ